MKRNLLISCLYTVVYIVIANILFYNNVLAYYAGDMEGLSTLLMFPAIIAFGAGYAGGTGAALIMILILFLVIWTLFFIFTFVARKIYIALRKNNS